MRNLSDLKAGDEVFVVHQASRGGTRRTEKLPIVKVGRQYAYISEGYREQRFHRSTGESAHAECNARMNGYGFDVYRNEQDYLKEVHEREEFERLSARMVDRWRGLKQLPPHVVEKIHNVLDKESGAENVVESDLR